MVDFLLDTELTPEQHECVTAIQKNASSLLQILNDILDLSKIEAGKMALDLVPFNLLLELEKVVEIFSYRVCEKSLQLYIHVDFDVESSLVGDPVRVRQILIVTSYHLCSDHVESYRKCCKIY
jgi:signal transduction histidine kinase